MQHHRPERTAFSGHAEINTASRSAYPILTWDGVLQSSRAQGNEQEVLSQQVLVMAGELEEQLAQLTRLRRLQTARPAGFPQPAPQPLRQASLAAGAQVSRRVQPVGSGCQQLLA